MIPPREDLAWAAGLFEGEGSFFINNKKADGKHYQGVTASLGSTDRDVLERFQAVLGVGHIRKHSPGDERWRQSWQWGTGKFEHAQYVACLLWPWLCERRRGQVHEALLAHRRYRAMLRERRAA